MRERRIRATAIPELQAAVKAGVVSTYRGGEIAKLSAAQQKIAVKQWAARHQYRRHGQAIAARVIRQQLRKYARMDLKRVAAAIRDAIALARL
jgi:hypothetical protein